jgi:16S rRNA (adenine1518-N6/adenine1519-N6)-dimethyltransferase
VHDLHSTFLALSRETALIDPNDSPFPAPSAALQALGRRADRHLSQSFLCEPGVARAMVAAADLSPSDTVLEIGPGLGMLTRELVRSGAHVVAVELDRTLAAALAPALMNPSNLEVIQADALTADLAEIVREPYVVVASLPYHVASPILFRLAFRRPQPRRVVAMVQQEVANRLADRGKTTSYLGAAFSLVADVRIVRRVSPGCFFPMPKVWSAVVRIELLPEPRVVVDSVDDFVAFLRAGFARPRKQLHNSLSQGLGTAPDGVQEAIWRSGVDPSKRPGALSLAEWRDVYQAVKSTAK